MDKEKLNKIRERFPYVDLCISKKTGYQVTLSVDTLYELMFTEYDKKQVNSQEFYYKSYLK